MDRPAAFASCINVTHKITFLELGRDANGRNKMLGTAAEQRPLNSVLVFKQMEPDSASPYAVGL